MRKLLLIFLLGVVAGAAGLYYYQQNLRGPNLDQARNSVATGAGKIKTAIQDKIGEINVDELKRELDRTGTVIREKAGQAGAAIADATANARTTASVKARLLNELGTAALSISVDTTDGLVTLSGTAASHEEIAKAIRVALETEGVRKVISTVQVKAAKS